MTKNRLSLLDMLKKLEQLSADLFSSLPPGWSEEEAVEFTLLYLELLERDKETIHLYEMLPVAKEYHFSEAHERGLSGSNRAGKSSAAAMEDGMAATGQHPAKGRYPTEGFQGALVGLSQAHLSLLYRHLFEKGLFKIFFHPTQYEWKVVVEDDPEHQKFKHLWEPSQPVIPRRFLATGDPESSVSWENKKEKIPNSVMLINDSILRFYSGLAVAMPQGHRFHRVRIDEELIDAYNWLTELRARLIDFDGYLDWSATPQRATEEFRLMEIRAKDPDNDKKPPSQQTAFFKMLSRDNKYISKSGRDAFEDKLVDNPEELKVRVHGEFPYDTMLVYPDFKENINVIEPYQLLWEDTRYIVIEPGSEEAGVLFVAVCAPATEALSAKIGDKEADVRGKEGAILVYDELLLRNTNAQILAQEVKFKLNSHTPGFLQDMTIDERAGRQTGIGQRGMQKTVGAVFWDELIKMSVLPADDRGFRYGTSDKDMGVNKVKMYHCHDLKDGLPKLFIFSTCKRLIYEFKAWRKKRTRQGNPSGYDEKNCTLLDCLRYACTRDLEWVTAPSRPPQAGTATNLKANMRAWQTGSVFFRK